MDFDHSKNRKMHHEKRNHEFWFVRSSKARSWWKWIRNELILTASKCAKMNNCSEKQLQRVHSRLSTSIKISSFRKSITGARESLLGETLKYNDPLRKWSVLSVR
jgi:hypothetical protein